MVPSCSGFPVIIPVNAPPRRRFCHAARSRAESHSDFYSQSATLSHTSRLRPFRYPSGRHFGRKMPRCHTLANYDHFLAWTSSFLVAICLPITKWQISTLFRYQQTAFWSQSASLSHVSSSRPFSSANNRDFGRKMPRYNRMAFYDHPSFTADLYGLRNFSTPYHSARAFPCAGLRCRVE